MSKELLKQALDALEHHTVQTRPIHLTDVTMVTLRAALAQPAANTIQVNADELVAYEQMRKIEWDRGYKAGKAQRPSTCYSSESDGFGGSNRSSDGKWHG